MRFRALVGEGRDFATARLPPRRTLPPLPPAFACVVLRTVARLDLVDDCTRRLEVADPPAAFALFLLALILDAVAADDLDAVLCSLPAGTDAARRTDDASDQASFLPEAVVREPAVVLDFGLPLVLVIDAMPPLRVRCNAFLICERLPFRSPVGHCGLFLLHSLVSLGLGLNFKVGWGVGGVDCFGLRCPSPVLPPSLHHR